MTRRIHQPGDLPFIVRLAGLDVEALGASIDSRCGAPLADLAATEAQLTTARTALVDRLFEAVHDADKAQRRILLGLKRDAFNGRPLARWTRREAWSTIAPPIRDAADEVLTLEDQHVRQQADLTTAVRAQSAAEDDALLSLAADPALRRGISLSSLVLARNLERVVAGQRLRGKRQRRLLTGMVRYATRAALKLSPFSTLTPVGLGVAGSEGDHRSSLVPRTDCRAFSGVWLHRYLLDQCFDLLSIQPTFRAGLDVRVNPSLETARDGRLRFLRPARWTLEAPEDEVLRRRKPALVRVRLTSPVVEAIREHLGTTAAPLGALVDELVTRFPERGSDDLRTFVDRLIEIGLLTLDTPWATDDVDGQTHLAAYLSSLPADPALETIVPAFDELTRRLAGFATSEEPTVDVAAGQRLIDAMTPDLLAAAGLDPSVRLVEDERDHYFSDDVFVVPDAASGSNGGDENAVLTVPTVELRATLDTVAPLARMAGTLDPRNDYLLTLGDAARERWPATTRVPLVDFFEATQPVYQDFIRFQMAQRGPDAPKGLASFNPRALDRITADHALRARVLTELKTCFAPDEDGQRLDADKLDALLDTVPERYSACRDFSAFLQAFERDDGGRRWVLSDLFEGAGRMSSRYTTAMPTKLGTRWSEAFAADSTIGIGGHAAEIVDLYSPAGHTINVHRPRTRRSIVLPGERLSLPPERVLHLGDLWVDLEGESPVLCDRDGQRLAPLHLGGVVVRYMPSLFKFLTFFGTTELNYRVPCTATRTVDGVRIGDRHMIGDVVYRRRSWLIERARVLPRFEALRGVALMTAVDRWRRMLDIPAQVFVQEPVEGGLANPHRKPQFVDFRSPTLVELFRTILVNDFPLYRLSEALPATHQHPRDRTGRRRAYEIQVDTFGALTGDPDSLSRRSAVLPPPDACPEAVAIVATGTQPTSA